MSKTGFVYNFIKHYWFVILALFVVVYLYYLNAYDDALMKDLLFRKLSLALFSVLTGYVVRRTILGYIDWQGAYKYVYALVIHIIVALAIIFG